ncbi:hypothetical protein [Paenibacillus cremeus]|uniref:Uncharacterized protein n=1 Tax=Paenibacillus cremeus TaxID=2163881 RepID=A0A559JM97_9BACL|nr:hypothetical protein [Paenibacillus cremeus]TVY00997.1 hypothetical protein FPZ49_32920 [Paenibacillus cremeus]
MTRTEQVTFLSSIQTKLSTGTEITAEDVSSAEQLVTAWPRPEHRIIHAAAKARYTAQQPEAIEDDEIELVTADQVEAARKAAAANPSIKNLAEYARLKQQLAGE